jgi:hypothetical protein
MVPDGRIARSDGRLRSSIVRLVNLRDADQANNFLIAMTSKKSHLRHLSSVPSGRQRRRWLTRLVERVNTAMTLWPAPETAKTSVARADSMWPASEDSSRIIPWSERGARMASSAASGSALAERPITSARSQPTSLRAAPTLSGLG